MTEPAKDQMATAARGQDVEAPGKAFAGLHLVVFGVAAIIIAIALVLYFVAG